MDAAPGDTLSPPTPDDVRDAAARIAGLAVRTPLLAAPTLSAALGRPVYLKPECLQRTGSFKFRGAYNKISRLSADERAAGVVAMSSGNHAQGVAAAAALAGTRATIVMPADAPAIKRRNTLGYGAQVVDYVRGRDDREAMAREIVARTGAVLVPPYDDPLIVAGQGTVGLEIAEDALALGLDLEAVVVPAGGGGLVAGIATAVRALLPSCAVYLVEPQGFDDHVRSLAAGERLRNARETGSICDALLAAEPGRLTFAINRRLVAGGLVVTDAQAGAAVACAFSDLKVVVEPGGAVGLAALRERLVPGTGAVAVVLSGGNVDAPLFAALIGADQPNSAS